MKSRIGLCAFIFAALASLTLTGCGGGSSANSTPAVHNEWAWMSGAQAADQLGSYGTQGTASPGNMPGARAYPAFRTDAAGNFWLFGGYGFASTSGTDNDGGDLNDLWEYSNGEWTWMSGSNQNNQWGSYGTEGTSASGNVPGARYWGVSWADKSGNLWLFGGLGWDSQGSRGYLNDLWKYSNGEWTWMSGSNLCAYGGCAGLGTPVYGTKGVPNAANTPGARIDASAWTDAAGNLWLFGGEGVDDGTYGVGLLNDLWKYAGGEWTWMAGPSSAQQVGVYGTLGTPNPSNTPGSRSGAATWTDAAGNLWLFGGFGTDVNGLCQGGGPPCELSDLWEFSPSLNEWTWMGGPDVGDEAGVYGTLGVAAPGNWPPPRQDGMTWTDSEGNFWLFGGDDPYQINDLWKYSGGEWTWMAGPAGSGEPGVYGTPGVPAAGNTPGCRVGSAAWTDKSGNLWLFGGQAVNGCTGDFKFNDLWEYQP